MHPRDNLLQPAVSILYSLPEVNFQSGRFFISTKEFESRVNIFTFQFWAIQIFAQFVKDNLDRVIDKGFVYGDLKVYWHFLDKIFLQEVLKILKSYLKMFL